MMVGLSVLALFLAHANGEEEDGCLTIGGANVGAKCVFPFSFDGIAYHGCTKVADDKPWCSTLTKNGVHVSGQNQWGYCNSQCPVEEIFTIG